MSRFDDLEDDDSFLNVNFKNNEQIEKVISTHYKDNKIKELITENQEYFDILIEKCGKEKINFENIEEVLFAKLKNKEEKTIFLIDYFKNKYGVLNGKLLKMFFDIFIEENPLTENDYKHFIIYNFNKETINLCNEEEKQIFQKEICDFIE